MKNTVKLIRYFLMAGLSCRLIHHITLRIKLMKHHPWNRDFFVQPSRLCASLAPSSDLRRYGIRPMLMRLYGWVKPSLWFLTALLLCADMLWSVPADAAVIHPTQRRIYLGDTPVYVVRYQALPSRIVYYHPHADEKTALVVAKHIIGQYGGTLIDVMHQHDTRLIRFWLQGQRYAVDPNRIFSGSGIVHSLRKYGHESRAAAEAVRDLAHVILSELSPFSLIIAVHNNLGHGFSLRYYMPGGMYYPDVKALYYNPALSLHTLVIVTHPVLFDFLKKRKVNVVLQDNKTVRDDGSLSYYAGKHDILYANVETMRGEAKEQARILSLLQSFPIGKNR